ncbi:MAG: ABC transporter permease [Planctomycetota bacterium]
MRRSSFPLLITVLVLVFLHLPILVLVAGSCNASRFGGSWEGFTLEWYRRLLDDRAVWHALRNTALIAIAATAVASVLGTAAALALHGFRTRLQEMHTALIAMPLVVPDILMGMSLLLLFVATGVGLGLFTVFLAHVTFCVSYVCMVVLARLQDFDASLIEAARDLGASRWAAVRHVLIPLIAPGIAAGALLAFTLSVDDFVVTFFVAGPGSTTLPIQIYSMIKHSKQMPVINALSTILLVATFMMILLTQRLRRESSA